MTHSDRRLALIEYPTSDGEPMGETDIHRDLMVDLIEALRAHYADNPDVYVSGNILLLYDQLDPNAHYSPDVLVALGVSNVKRENYKLWEIGKAPELVVEVTSKSTRLRDLGPKKGLYEAIGVREYVLFDPRTEYLEPRLQVYRNEGSGYLPAIVPDESGYHSLTLGLVLREVEGQLRIFDPATNSFLKTPSEHAAYAKQQATYAKEQEAYAKEQEAYAKEQEAYAKEQEAYAKEQEANAKEQEANAKEQAERAERLAQKLRELGIDPDQA